MIWKKFDVAIDGDHYRVGHLAFPLVDISNPEIFKEEQSSTKAILYYGLSVVTAVVGLTRCQSLPYDTGLSPFARLQFVVLLFLVAVVFGVMGTRQSARAPEVKWILRAEIEGHAKTLYSHSDEKVLKEIKAALVRALGKRKR